MQNDDYYVVFVFESILPEGPSPLEEVEDKLKDDIRKDKIANATSKLASELRDQITSGITFDEVVTQEKGYDLVTNETKSLNKGFTSIGRSNYVTGALLNAETGDILGPLKTLRGYAIIFVKDIMAIDSTEYEVRKDILKNNLLSNKQNQVFENWLKQLEDEADIEDFRKYHY